MATQKKQIKPIYGILLIGFFSALSIVTFIYKDHFLPNQNAAYEEL